MNAVEYLRVLVAGVCAQAWRVMRGLPCPCPHCRGHRQFVAQTEAAYNTAVRRRGPAADYLIFDEAHVFADADGDAFRMLPTLGEARHGWHR